MEKGGFDHDEGYCDGIDQTGLLLADGGQSARRSRPYTLNQYFSAIRVDEFKYTFTAEIENGIVQQGDIGGFSGAIVTDTGGAVAFNLYTNPREDAVIGVRHLPMVIPVANTAGWYVQELIKYPPRLKIGSLDNNPPIYNLVPKIREMAGKAPPAH